MGTINPDLTGIVDGAVGDAADWTTPFNTIINLLNGGLDTDNFTANNTNLATIAAPTAWTSFATVWGSVSGGIAPAIGNGTLNCRYRKVGRIITISWSLVGGSSTTWGDTGTKYWLFSLPYTVSNSSVNFTGSCIIRDSSASAYYAGVVYVGANGTDALLVTHGLTNPVSSTAPVTFAANDDIDFDLTYESAS